MSAPVIVAPVLDTTLRRAAADFANCSVPANVPTERCETNLIRDGLVGDFWAAPDICKDKVR